MGCGKAGKGEALSRTFETECGRGVTKCATGATGCAIGDRMRDRREHLGEVCTEEVCDFG